MMGKAIDLVRTLSPEHAAVLDDLKDQLLIVFVKRLGGRVEFPLSEVDDTGQDLLAFAFDPDTRRFLFQVQKKS